MIASRWWRPNISASNAAHWAPVGAETDIPIAHRLTIRGSYMSGFTYACRRPKPFDIPEWQVTGTNIAKADIYKD